MKKEKDLYSGILSELIKKVQGVIASDDKELGKMEDVEAKETLKDDKVYTPNPSHGDEEKEPGDKNDMSEEELREYVSLKKKKAPKKATAIFASIKSGNSMSVAKPNAKGSSKKG